MHAICLKDNWTLTVLGKNVYDIPETPIETKVPSTVYGTLLEKGLIPDPFYRDNELDALKLMENDFAYETEIVIGEEDRKADRLFLHFDGIDTIADVYLNGEKIGSADNMNRVWEYDITDLVAGDAADTVYQVKVILHSPTKFIAEEDSKMPGWQQPPMQCRDSRISVKQRACTAGTGARVFQMQDCSVRLPFLL